MFISHFISVSVCTHGYLLYYSMEYNPMISLFLLLKVLQLCPFEPPSSFFLLSPSSFSFFFFFFFSTLLLPGTHQGVPSTFSIFCVSPGINHFSKKWRIILNHKNLDPTFVHYCWGVIPFSHSQWTQLGNTCIVTHPYTDISDSKLTQQSSF